MDVCFAWVVLVLIIKVQETPVKRLCKTHNIITVNGQFPGPTLEVREGDTLVINVVNRAQYDVTIHWYVLYSSMAVSIMYVVWSIDVNARASVLIHCVVCAGTASGR